MADENIKQVIEETIRKELSISKIGCQACSAMLCKEKCDITPAEHAQDHKDWRAFRDAMGRCANIAQHTVVKTFVGVGLLALFTGLYFLFTNFKQSGG